MTEKTILLEEIDPIDIYGVNNRLINLLKSYFPKMSVVARGSEIILKGSAADVKRFESKIELLTEMRMRKSRLTEDDVNSLFDPLGSGTVETKEDDKDVIVFGNEGKIIRARTKNQRRLVESYYKNDLIFAIGPAGTGKTYTAIALAVRALKNKEVKRLILTRPAVEAGERLGFLPGDLREKLDPYLQPLYDALRDMIPAKKLELLMEEGIIQIAPLAYMRGRTLESAFVILDEAQNTTFGQLKMFLTRMGGNSKFIVTGDATQIDLPKRSDSGLLKGADLLGKIKGVCRVDFTKEDIVRHKLVSKIVQAFDEHEEESLNQSSPHLT
ncbi:MAG: phosphate starvation-inducible protein PhoH [Bacteroidetes bacterium 41-46]|nr:MAG: phosphate starvation-inducible protein PhoH [Bacteroidetes bacterium 41-46]